MNRLHYEAPALEQILVAVEEGDELFVITSEGSHTTLTRSAKCMWTAQGIMAAISSPFYFVRILLEKKKSVNLRRGKPSTT